MPTTLIEYTGTFYRQKQFWSDSGVGVCELQDGTIIKGKFEEGEFIHGVPYTFYGTWESYRSTKQFCFRNFRKNEPHSKHGLVKYLEAHAPNIGPALAGRLFDEFKQDAVKVLRTDPCRAAATIKGLSPDKAKEAAAALQKISALEDTRIELMDLFASRGFSNDLAKQVISKWGVAAPLRIRKDPFTLLVNDFHSCGFNRCDRLYLDLGLPPDRLKRQVICLWHVIKEDSSGNTWSPLKLIAAKMRQLVSGGLVDAKKAVRLGIRAKWLAIKKDASGENWVSIAEKAEAEEIVAAKVKELMELIQQEQWNGDLQENTGEADGSSRDPAADDTRIRNGESSQGTHRTTGNAIAVG